GGWQRPVRISLGLLPSGADPVGEEHVRANLPAAIWAENAAMARGRGIGRRHFRVRVHMRLAPYRAVLACRTAPAPNRLLARSSEAGYALGAGSEETDLAKRRHRTALRTSSQDIAVSRKAPDTPQTRSAAYRLAFADDEFMTSEDTRGVRFQLEYLKPEFRLRQHGIVSTVVLFGGARIPEPGKPAWAARNQTQKRNLEAASRYYDEARRFAQLAAQTSAATDFKEFVVVTG